MDILLGLTTIAALAILLIVLLRQRPDAAPPVLQTELTDLRTAVAGLTRAQGEDAGEFRGMLGQISQAQASVAEDTGKLSEALRRPAVRGQWGELTLRNVVESAGLAHHVDFDTQVHIRGDGGDPAVRPDLVIRLPGAGAVPVDAKVPLDAFLDAIDAETPEARDAALDRHVAAVRTKISDLASKAYWQRFSRAPEVVVMFIGSEAAFSAAIERDPSLLEQAGRQRVVIATPATMLALLQVVSLTWREHDLSENAKRVQQLATELVKRLGIINGHLSGVGRALGKAVDAHNSAVGSYESRLLVTARQLADLGIREAAELAEPDRAEGAVRQPAAVAELPEPDPEITAAVELPSPNGK